MAQLFHLPRAVPITSAGRPYPGALANFYLTGTVTRANTYTTDALSTPHSNPVVADAGGMFPAIYLDPNVIYKLVLTQQDTTLIYAVDPISEGESSATPSYPITAAETAAAAVVVNDSYPELNPLRYTTNTVPGTTDMTVALQTMFNVGYQKGGDTYEIPAGTYLFTGNLRPPISVDTSSRTFRLHGAGMQVTKLVTSNSSGIQIYGDDPPGGDNVMVSIDIDGFEMTNTGTAVTGIGIDLYHCQRGNIGNVRITNFNYGIRARSTWNFSLGKRAQLDSNNVGFKVPRASASHVGFNTAQISGISCANNLKAGLSIASGNSVTVDDVLLESNPVGMYIIEDLHHVRFSTAYYEAGGITFTEVNRAGADQPYLLITGKDEDDLVGDTAIPVTDLQLGCLMSHAGEGVVWLENVNGVTFLDGEYGRNYVIFSSNVLNVRSTTIEGLNTISTPLVTGKSKSTARNVLRDFSQNWIPNGNFALNSLPYMVLSGATTAGIITSTINGVDARTLEIVCPNGDTTVTVDIPIAALAGAEYASGGSNVVASMHALAGSSDFATATIQFADEATTALAGGAVKSSALTTLFVLSCASNPNENVAANNVLYLRLTLTRTTGTGAASFYIDELRVSPYNHAQLEALGVFDTLVGLSGTVTAGTTTGAAWFYGEVNTGLSAAEYFDVIASPYGSAEVAVSWKIDKLTGGDAGKFRIIASVDETVFSYFIVPRVMRLP